MQLGFCVVKAIKIMLYKFNLTQFYAVFTITINECIQCMYNGTCVCDNHNLNFTVLKTLPLNRTTDVHTWQTRLSLNVSHNRIVSANNFEWFSLHFVRQSYQ